MTNTVRYDGRSYDEIRNKIRFLLETLFSRSFRFTEIEIFLAFKKIL